MNAIELSALVGAGALLGGRRHRVMGAAAMPAAVYALLYWEAWWRRKSVEADASLAKLYTPAPAPAP